jgi:hypothetical protein
VTGPVARQRQRRIRPRIAYPTTPSTIRIISTHNHPGIAASLVGAAAAQADATAAHPDTQLPGVQAASWVRIGGRAARGLAGIAAPAACPPELGWPGGRRWAARCLRWAWARRPRRRVTRLLAGREATP